MMSGSRPRLERSVFPSLLSCLNFSLYLSEINVNFSTRQFLQKLFPKENLAVMVSNIIREKDYDLVFFPPVGSLDTFVLFAFCFFFTSFLSKPK